VWRKIGGKIEKKEAKEVLEEGEMTLITRAPYDEDLAHVPEEARRSDFLLKRLDELLDDEELLEQVRADLARRYRLTPLHGGHSTPVEVILRLFVLKQLFNWGFEQTEKQVRKSALLQWFCRIVDARVPDDTTLLRWVQLIQPETKQEITQRVLGLFTQSHKGRKMQTKRKAPKER
jgi:transposase, IS5 family